MSAELDTALDAPEELGVVTELEGLLTASAELDANSRLDMALDTLEGIGTTIELEGRLLKVTLDRLETLAIEQLAANEALEEVGKACLDDEDLASQFPNPAWHPVPQ